MYITYICFTYIYYLFHFKFKFFFSISIYLPNTLFHLHPPHPQITTLFTIFELVKNKSHINPLS